MRDLKKRAKNIRLLLLDVDGVLTDGRIIHDDSGKEWKFFDVRDGHGIKLIQRGGVEVGILSGRKAKAVLVRARELGIQLSKRPWIKQRPWSKLKKGKRSEPNSFVMLGMTLWIFRFFPAWGWR